MKIKISLIKVSFAERLGFRAMKKTQARAAAVGP
jgi:hypothetical protein